MKITDILKHKRILIWGYGREGKSTERFINQFCDVESLEIFEGKVEDINEDLYDYIIKSPGIKVDSYSSKYTSQTELFLREFASQTIGITGTKGKSTTSSLFYYVLSKCLDGRVFLVGNIGFPCLDHYGEIEEDSVIVYEMSCHQLSHLSLSPHIALFLNLYEDHLDYYGTLDKYFEAKKNITTHQSSEDYYFCGENVPEIETAAKKRIIPFESPLTFDMTLKGMHNQFNARFVYTICTELFGCSEENVRTYIETFHALEHRMEYVGNVKGVEYYNDSISTIPEATMRAIASIKNVKTILVGGMDRHINYDSLIEFIKQHPEYNYIMSYTSGKRIFDEVSSLSYCYYRDDLKESVILAKQITPEGCACLFSPAAASYGFFKNFEERGKVFKELVVDDNIK